MERNKGKLEERMSILEKLLDGSDEDVRPAAYHLVVLCDVSDFVDGDEIYEAVSF